MAHQASARIFASHYQLVVCDDPDAFDIAYNWGPGDSKRGFAGHERFRMVGTEADLNDHWVDATLSAAPPDLESWQRVTCVGLKCTTGEVHIMSVIDQEPPITLSVPIGEYAVYFAANNLGIDQHSLGEEHHLTDTELAERKDIEWYRVHVVPGAPQRQGRIKDA